MSSQDLWKTLKSRYVYENQWLKVREDKVVTPGGSEGIYSIIESKPGVLIIALTENNEIYLQQVFRYPLQEWRWELPAGGVDKGDSPLMAAEKELQEESGLAADTWLQLGDIYPSNNGPMNDHNFVFLAQNLHKVAHHHETGEAIKSPKAVPLEVVFDMIQTGELTDGQSLSALLHFKLWHERQVPKQS